MQDDITQLHRAAMRAKVRFLCSKNRQELATRRGWTWLALLRYDANTELERRMYETEQALWNKVREYMPEISMGGCYAIDLFRMEVTEQNPAFVQIYPQARG